MPNPVNLVLQPDAAAGMDTHIRESEPDDNFGTLIVFNAGKTNSGIHRGLLAFDLSALPKGSIIVSATLTLYCAGENDAADYVVGVHRALTQWFEGAQSGDAPGLSEDASTWNHRNANGSVAWAGGAGGGAGSDYVAQATDSQLITGFNTDFSWDVTADVQAWSDGEENYGWWLINASENVDNSVKIFRSSDATQAETRPKLTIIYHNLVGTAAGTATVSGALSLSGYLQGEILAQATVGGTLSSNQDLSGAAQGSATASAALMGVGYLAGNVGGQAQVQGKVIGTGFLGDGSADGSTVGFGHLQGRFAVSGQAEGKATTSATAYFVGMLRGAIVGIATTSAVGYAKATSKATVIGCNPVPLLYITDGVVKPNGQLNLLNLLSEKYGYKLRAYRPSVAQYKEGGRFSSSPLSQGRRLTFRTFDNAVDVFELTATGHDQDYLIEFQQELIAFQEAAADYWISNWTANPVYLVARAARETNTRYAIIHAMSIAELPNPYTQPFFNHGQVSFDTLTLRVERGHWLSTPPGEFECVEISSIRSWTVSGWESGS